MEILAKETYLEMVQNAVGSKLFQTLYVNDDGQKKDILRKGSVSCAFFVSTILNHFKLVGAPHATVRGTVLDMEQSGWRKTDTLEPGVVIVWEEREQKGERHAHIGVSLGADRAVSNDPEGDTPIEHEVTFNGTRKIEALYTHDFLQ